MPTFNYNRLMTARKRRQLTLRGLAELSGLTPDTLTRLEKGRRIPEKATIIKLAEALNYPEAFFMKHDLSDLDSRAVSFRSFSRMSARKREAAEEAGRLGIEFCAWVEQRFTLADADLPSFEDVSPSDAATLVRSYWGIGHRPIGSMIDLLEAKGVRVFALNENNADVNAFSFWRDGKAYVFLNHFKTPESSFFDAAHELGHLLMHREGTIHSDVNKENEANQFASEFTMPRDDVRSHIRGFVDANLILELKKRWRVSAFALLRRVRDLELLFSDSHYTRLCIELTRRGFRTDEPGGMSRQASKMWGKILSHLWTKHVTLDHIAGELSYPIDEINNLISPLLNDGSKERNTIPVQKASSMKDKLYIVK